MERFVITANIEHLRKLLREPDKKLNRDREHQIRQLLAQEEARLLELEQEEAALR